MKINTKQHVTRTGQLKKNPVKLPYKKVISKDGEKYTLGLVSKDNVYYENAEGDILMYDRSMKLISDNYFGQQDYITEAIRAIKTKNYVYMSQSAQTGAKYAYEEDLEEYEDLK